MTTEMGESLCYSWLKHIKGCQFVQTNWKASMSWDHSDLDLNVLDNAKNWFGQKYTFTKAKYTSDSIFKTTECDVVGLQLLKTKRNKANDGIQQKVYGVEVAFHENGLDYGGSKDNTIEKVLSKCIRIALCLRSCFPEPEIELFFATPAIKKSKEEDLLTNLEDAFKTLNREYQQVDKNVRFTLLANDKFKNRIVRPLLIRSDSIADTSELFIRSCQLLKLIGANLDKAITKDYLDEIEPMSDIVWNYLVPIIKKKRISDLKDFTSGNFFSLKWPVLITNREGHKDRDRYYATPIKKGKTSYYLTNHWTKHNKEALIDWIVKNQN